MGSDLSVDFIYETHYCISTGAAEIPKLSAGIVLTSYFAGQLFMMLSLVKTVQ